jgi:hypothetical protein
MHLDEVIEEIIVLGPPFEHRQLVDLFARPAKQQAHHALGHD